MSELEALKKKKLQEMRQAGGQEALQRQQEEQAMEAQLDSLLRSVLTPEAKSRLSNIRLVNKDLYLKMAQSLLYLAKSGQLPGKLDDAQLKSLLEKVREKKREISITRK
jgi:programmed cell death protein 5